jgi:hypothetical protein
MIGKLMINESFDATFGYCFNKTEARIVGGNVALSAERLNMTKPQAKEFVKTTSDIYDLSRNQNCKVKRPVCHIALSLPYEDSLTDEQWSDLGDRYLAGLILSSQEPTLLDTPEIMNRRMTQFVEDELPTYQYAIIQHNDQKHRHAHIVLSRVNLETGKAVATWRDRYRSQKVIRLLESEFGLRQQPNSWEVGRKEQSKNQILKEAATGIASVRLQLQQMLDALAVDRPSMPELIERLQAKGVTVRVDFTRTGTPRGISYALDGVAIAGSKLGNRYSFNGLQRQLGIEFKPDHQERIHALLKLSPEQRQQVEKIAPVMLSILKWAKRSTFVFKRYTLTRKKDTITFFESQNKQVIAQATWVESEQRWQARENTFTPELWAQWQALQQAMEPDLRQKGSPAQGRS